MPVHASAGCCCRHVGSKSCGVLTWWLVLLAVAMTLPGATSALTLRFDSVPFDQGLHALEGLSTLHTSVSAHTVQASIGAGELGECSKSQTGTLPPAFIEYHKEWCSLHSLDYTPPNSILTSDERPRLVVWTSGGGFWYHDLVNALLSASFPGLAVVWSRNAHVHCHHGSLSLALQSVMPWDEPWDAPSHFPLIVWNGEPTVVAPNWTLPRVPLLHFDTRLSIPDSEAVPHTVHYFPLLLARCLSGRVPMSLRQFDDDITTRQYDVCYINSNCVPVREDALQLLSIVDQCRLTGTLGCSQCSVALAWRRDS